MVMSSGERRHVAMFKQWAGEVTYPGLQFHIDTFSAGDTYLQVRCSGTCNVTGSPYEWRGRKWYLSMHMCKSEFIQTAFMAVLAAIEHEARELFKYKGQSVLGPHFDLDIVHQLCVEGAEQHRDEPTEG